MKTSFISILISVAVLFFAGCNPGKQNKGNLPNTQVHDHSHDGHDHNHDHEHNHEHNHEGHDHDHDHDHDHSHEGHNHESHTSAEHNHDHEHEITLSLEQARMIGLETETVVPAPFAQVIKTSGQVLAAQGDERAVIATSNGVVSFAGAASVEGSAVKSGQAIVSISAGSLLDGDPATRARISFQAAEKEFKRAEGLVKEQIVSQKEFDEIKARYETAKTAFEAQAANVSANGVRVTSPINGFIKSRAVNEGDYVSVGQLICTVSQNRRLQLRADVPETHFKSLAQISTANFAMAYDNNTLHKLKELNGRLISFGKASGNQSAFLPVTFEFDNIGEILPGSFATVYLVSGEDADVISVPLTALTEEQSLFFVYLRVDEIGYEKREVTLGANDGERVRILSGLQEGDRVVTQGAYQVKLAGNQAAVPEAHNHNH